MRNSQRASFETNEYKLDAKTISQAYLNAKTNNQALGALTNIFHSIQLAEKNRENPGTYTDQIIELIKLKMLNNVQLPRNQPILDPKAIYPLSKNGALGVLYRECTIVEKGVQQKQGNKAPVVKQVVGFINRIESEKTKNNQKLEWVKDNKVYPFRLILRDNKNAIKAIYFKTSQQAEKVRVYYVNKFGYKGNISKVMKEPAHHFSDICLQLFKSKLIAYKNEKKQKMMQTKKKIIQPQIKSPEGIQRNTIQRNNQSNNLQNILNKSINKSNKGYDTDVMKLLIDQQQSRISTRNANQGKALNSQKISKLQSMYVKDLFDAWAKRAHQEEDSKQIGDAEESIRNVNTFNMPNQSKGKRKYENPSPLKNQPAIAIKKKQESLTYKAIQFLRQNTLLVKPLVTITLYRAGKIQSQTKFNTVIQKKDPHLCYELIPSAGEQTHKLTQHINQYQIGIKAVDHLTNSQMCNDKIQLKSKVLSYNTLVTNITKTVRLELTYDSNNVDDQKCFKFEDNPQGCFLQIKPLGEDVIQQIRGYWQKQAVKRSYYNVSKDIRIIQIFQLYEQPIKSWSLGLTESQYNLINLLNSASKILKFRLIQSALPIIKAIQKIYSDFDELIEVFLSIMINYCKPYYFISQLNKTNKLHFLLGLDGQIQYPSKIGLQMQIIKRMIKIQCPQFEESARIKNIGYVHLLYQYIYEIYSRNFPIRTLIQVWNFLFKQSTIIPVYLSLLSVWIIKFYSQKLIKSNNFKELKQILQSNETCPAEVIIRELLILRQKYFNSAINANIVESIKGLFILKPFQQAVVEFYKKQTERLDHRKQNRTIQKNLILQKLSNQMLIQLPKYPSRTYCFHIYFYKLPPVVGSLYIKANNIEYQCLNIPSNRYFIIGEVNTQIGLEFINNKSEQFTAKLQCMQGINKYTTELKSESNNQVYEIQYICGLLTEGHIDALKKNRKFQHFIGTYVRQEQIFDEFLRPINQCFFLNTFNKKLDKDDLNKKIKVVFSNGNKNFEELQFYIRWIYVSSITITQKLKLIKDLTNNISYEYFLSGSKQLQKIFLYLFLRIAHFQLTPQQFKSYYSNSIQSQFSAPKIFKCRLILPNGTQHKLQAVANSYLSRKTLTHLHQDIIINELINNLQKQVQASLVNISEATLNIVYFSFGQVKSIQIPIIKKKSSKDFTVDESKFQFQNGEKNDIATAQPQILMTQNLPTFSKISTILDFVHSSKSVDSLTKFKQPHKKIPQSINLLKNCDLKFNKVIVMRYRSYPNSLQFPFLTYFHQLLNDELQPEMPRHLFLNNLQTDIKSICLHSGKLNFFDNKRLQPTPLIHSYGIYGNLRIIPPKTQSLYFVTVFPQEQPKPNGLYFVNYGHGIYRWEPCTVLGYSFVSKQKQTHLKGQKKLKKEYLIKYNGRQRYCKQHQLKIDSKISHNLQQMDTQKSLSKSNFIKEGEHTGIKSQQHSKIGSISQGGSKQKLNF